MRILVTLLILPLLTSSIQLPTVIEHLPPGFEEYRERVPTSGARWVGFTSAERMQRVDARRAFIRLPAGEGGLLCIDINSRDGRYFGQFQFPLPQRRPRAVQLNIPTEYRRELATYSPRDVVASVQLAQSCPSSQGLHLPVSWAWPVVADSVVININSTLPVHLVWNSRGVSHRISCQRLTAGRSAAFNHSCLVSRTAFGDSTQVAVRSGRLGSYTEIWKTVKLP